MHQHADDKLEVKVLSREGFAAHAGLRVMGCERQRAWLSVDPAFVGRRANRCLKVCGRTKHTHECGKSDTVIVVRKFRPGRKQHDALDALYVAITQRKVSWILDADIKGFFDAIDHEWMMHKGR